MYTKIKTDQEIESMRRAGLICSEVLYILKNTVASGMNTKKLADIAKKEIESRGGSPAFLGTAVSPMLFASQSTKKWCMYTQR